MDDWRDLQNVTARVMEKEMQEARDELADRLLIEAIHEAGQFEAFLTAPPDTKIKIWSEI